MKNILRILFPTILLMTLLCDSASAQTPKIATVDLGKVFTNYYKTKLAQVDLDDRKTQISKDENSAVDDLKKGQADYQTLLAAANDQALSSDERDRKKQAADAKLKQLQDSKNALDEYDRVNKSNLADQFQRMREKILAEIIAVVNSKAKAGGYNLVLDAASETVNATPVLLYNSGGAFDLTDDVIKQLNAGAPIDLNTPAPTLSPSMSGTNKF